MEFSCDICSLLYNLLFSNFILEGFILTIGFFIVPKFYDFKQKEASSQNLSIEMEIIRSVNRLYSIILKLFLGSTFLIAFSFIFVTILKNSEILVIGVIIQIIVICSSSIIIFKEISLIDRQKIQPPFIITEIDHDRPIGPWIISQSLIFQR